jgi:hypothetical protein
LSQDAPFSARVQSVTWLARHRDPSQLDLVLVLPVAAFGRGQVPTVSLDQLDYLANLQRHEEGSSDVVDTVSKMARAAPRKPATARRSGTRIARNRKDTALNDQGGT